MHKHGGPGGGQTAYSVFPVGNYKFGAKAPKPEKENTTEGRLARIKAKCACTPVALDRAQ